MLKYLVSRRVEEERKTKPKPSAASIFGGAKPVDTTAREKEIEQKLNKLSVGGEEEGEKLLIAEVSTKYSLLCYIMTSLHHPTPVDGTVFI